MLLVISKLFGAMLDPVGFTLFIFAVGFFFAVVLRRPRASAVIVLCGFSSLLIFGSPPVSHFLIRGLEGRHPPLHYHSPASAVVLLGGATTGKIPPRIHVETNFSANRIFHAVRVFRQSNALYLVLTGGIVDVISEEVIPEAYSMFELINEMFGIDTVDVIFEDRSKNTRENAVYTKKIMDEAGIGSDIILVTSAYHMPRSVAIFEKAGFTVTPAPTGFFANDFLSAKPLTWLPNSGAMHVSSIALREYFGTMAYKIMGWI